MLFWNVFESGDNLFESQKVLFVDERVRGVDPRDMCELTTRKRIMRIAEPLQILDSSVDYGRIEALSKSLFLRFVRCLSFQRE